MATYADRNTIQSYAKTHVHWTERFVPGRELKVFEAPFAKIGITICFDAAFSEVWRVLALKGADVVVNISAVPKEFPVGYMSRRLAGAAVFNQVYVVYANRAGPIFSGHSAVFNPKGETIKKAERREAVIEAEIDLKEVAGWRAEEQIFPHRRPLLYREIVNRHRAESLVTESQIREAETMRPGKKCEEKVA
jgi:predicted amidohydrolase